MNRTTLLIIGIVVVIAGIVVSSAAFIVRQTEQAIVMQFGDPKRVIQQPGLHFKLPFIQDVSYFDMRVLDFMPTGEEVIAADQKRFIVDSFLRYRIIDPLRFYQSVGNEFGAEARLSGILNSSLRRVIGTETLESVLSDERANIMGRIRDQVNEAAVDFGIDVIDVRIRRTDLPEENAEAIYARMNSEREREAREFRAQGEEMAQRIRARADRERAVLLAESNRRAQILRGEGDAEAITIFADAFGRDPQFYSFFRSMEAYRVALGDESTTLVLSPRNAFFTFFDNLDGMMVSPDAPLAAPTAEGAADAGSDIGSGAAALLEEALRESGQEGPRSAIQ